MRTPSLRRAALAASAVVVLALPAAAQSDAAFASALAARPAGLATLAQLKTQSQVPPAPAAQGPVAPAAAWQKLLDMTAAEAAVSVDTTTKVVTLTLEDSGTTPDGVKTLVGILALTTRRPDGKHLFHHVLLSLAETRAVSKTEALTDHWFLEVYGNGRLRKATYFRMVSRETPNGVTTVEEPPVIMDLQAPATKELFDYIVAGWTE